MTDIEKLKATAQKLNDMVQQIESPKVYKTLSMEDFSCYSLDELKASLDILSGELPTPLRRVRKLMVSAVQKLEDTSNDLSSHRLIAQSSEEKARLKSMYPIVPPLLPDPVPPEITEKTAQQGKALRGLVSRYKL